MKRVQSTLFHLSSLQQRVPRQVYEQDICPATELSRDLIRNIRDCPFLPSLYIINSIQRLRVGYHRKVTVNINARCQ